MAKFLLLLSLGTLSFSAFAAGTGEMSDKELSNKFIASIQESRIQDQLTNSTEFKACEKEGKLEVGKGAENKAAIQKITDCFKKNLEGKTGKQLETLSEKMGLQSYGLVKSKNSQEITNYLSKKVSHALTGVDPDEKDIKDIIEKSKFKNQNIVDQSVFLKLYQTQLGKNILLEISRFCYQDLKNPNVTGPTKASGNFKAYWSVPNKLDETVPIGAIVQTDPKVIEKKVIEILVDKGIEYVVTDADVTIENKKHSATKVYPFQTSTKFDDESKIQLKSIAESFQDLDQGFSKDFFTFCSKLIKPMCKAYEENVSKNPAITVGAKACLTQARLEQYRKALSTTSDYLKKMEEDPQGNAPIFNIAGMKVYDGSGENSIDAITSISSSDVMQAQSKQYKAKIENFDSSKCTSSPELAECEVLIDQDQSDFEIDNVRLKMSLKNEAEIARLVEMKKKNDQNLEKYLKENGYADIWEKIDKINDTELREILENKFNARKEAYLAGLKDQISPYQIKGENSTEEDAMAAIEKVKQQPAQLAQLVMFNNIISSSLELKKCKDCESLGRNTSGIDREMRDAKSTGLETSYFSGFKGSDSETPKNNNNQNISITGLQFLDSILGFEEEKPE